MHIDLKATALELTPALKAYIEEKIGSLAKFVKHWEAGSSIECRVEVGRTTSHHHKGNVFRAEVNLDLPGRVLRAENEGWDVRAAIDGVRDKLKVEIQRYKEITPRT